MRVPALALLLMGACSSASSPPSSPEGEPGEVRQPASPSAQPSAAQPLQGCSHVAIEQTDTWTCGPHRLVRARYPDGLPPDRPGTWVGEAPQTSGLAVSIGGRTVEAQALAQPELDGERLVTVVARDPIRSQIGSCALQLHNHQDRAGVEGWCAAALGAVLGEE